MSRTCKRGDRDFPETVCGYPLPCPYHTVILDTTQEVPKVIIPATETKKINKKTLKKLKQIANILTPDKK